MLRDIYVYIYKYILIYIYILIREGMLRDIYIHRFSLIHIYILIMEGMLSDMYINILCVYVCRYIFLLITQAILNLVKSNQTRIVIRSAS